VSQVRRSTKREREWLGWTGTIEQLVSLGREARTLFEKRVAVLVAEYDEDNRLAQEAGTFDAGLEQLRRAEFEGQHGFQVSITDGADQTIGNLEDIVAEIDRRSLVEIEFRCGIYSREVLRIRLRRGPQPVVILAIESADPGWAREAFSHLSDKIDLGKPRWAWLHSTRGTAAFGVVNAIALAVVLSAIISTISKHPSDTTSTVLVNVWLWSSVLFGFFMGSAKTLNRLMPPFELNVGDSDPTGTRFWLYVGALVVSIPVGIFVNVIS
jgi:hypothetical protein